MSNLTSTRIAYGKALEEFGGNERIVALDADLSICTMTNYFAEKYPDRFVNLGIAECNMITAAAGIATTKKIVFCHSFAMFTAGRGYDQIRNSIAYPDLNVKIVGSHAGLTIGMDGATHQCLEDISLMRTVPGMTVVVPSDARETRAVVKAAIDNDGPFYIRTSRYETQHITDFLPNYEFILGKGVVFSEGSDVTIISTGVMTEIAVGAVDLLKHEGIEAKLINIHTIKPIDEDLILSAAKETGAIVTCEEHSIIGGLGSAVSEVVCEKYPIPVMRIGVKDTFGRSGKPDELLRYYGLTEKDIALRAKDAIALKR